MSTSPIVDLPRASRSSAKARLLTVLGEFVLPTGGHAWTSTLVGALAELDIAEKNARQAIARVKDQGLISSQRHGRQVRWSLTDAGRNLLEPGAARIYSFGTTNQDWNGQWLLAHSPVAEAQRSLRNQLRTKLGFLGFGELSASLHVSPHLDRELDLRRVLNELGLAESSTILRSSSASQAEDADLVRRAWDLDALIVDYDNFIASFSDRTVPSSEARSFTDVVALVHAWRRFPFADPELPTDLLPHPWAGRTAADLFHDRHRAWSPAALRWFRALDAD